MGVLIAKPHRTLTALWLVLKRTSYQLLLKVIFIFYGLVISTFFDNLALADESLEYGVKAAFLYKFGSYVEWPATAFASPTSPLNLCIMGNVDDFGATLEKVIGKESINGRGVIVRQIKSVERDNGCHILYIDASESRHAGQIVETVRGSHVLTVSDAGSAGIIDFVISNNRVRFNIDDEAAAQNGLVISSKLLSVALKVKRRASKGV
jgi:hypothetical protein